jgi:hypothetical protein
MPNFVCEVLMQKQIGSIVAIDQKQGSLSMVSALPLLNLLTGEGTVAKSI